MNSHSVRRSVWLRQNGVRVDQSRDIRHNVIGSSDLPPEAKGEHLLSFGPTDWLAKLRSALNEADLETAKSRLADLRLRDDSPNGGKQDVLTGYAEWLISQNKIRGHSLTVKRINTIVSMIRNHVLELFQNDIRDMHAEDYEEIYWAALELQRSLGMRRHLASVISSFHEYLINQRGAENIDTSELLAYSRVLASVDANIINEAQFNAAIAQLRRMELEAPHPDIIRICCHVLTICYRCGTRRREAIGLRMADLHLDSPEIILIRSNSFRKAMNCSCSKNPFRTLFSLSIGI